MRTSKSFTMRRGGAPLTGDWFSITNKDDDTEEVIIYDEIGFWGTSAEDFVKKLNKIEKSNIHLRLNSPGGQVFDGVAIYNALKRHDAKVSVFIDGLAASAASFIAQAGDEVYALEGSVMMIHDGMALCMGNEEDMLETAGVLSKISNNIAGIYARRAGGTVEDWRAMMKEEMWYTADEAVEAKLADSVVEPDEEADDVEEAAAQWDLKSVFMYAGREEAPDPADVREKIADHSKEKSMAGSKTKLPAKDTETQTGPESQPADKGTETAAGTEATAGQQVAFVVNGETVTDPAAVQTHITALETAQKETTASNRRTFVEQLGRDNKILASDLDATIEFAQSLDADTYAKWSALQKSAPAQPVFGNMGTQPRQENNNSGGDDDAKAREDLEATLAMHRLTGMDEEKIKETPSYKALQALDAKS